MFFVFFSIFVCAVIVIILSKNLSTIDYQVWGGGKDGKKCSFFVSSSLVFIKKNQLSVLSGVLVLFIDKLFGLID